MRIQTLFFPFFSPDFSPLLSMQRDVFLGQKEKEMGEAPDDMSDELIA